jgi:hypothetical protein
VRAGFLPATTRLMRTAPAIACAAPLQQEACRALATLAFGDVEGRAALRESDARRALTAAIDAHPTDGQIQQMARELLTQMTDNGTSRRQK